MKDLSRYKVVITDCLHLPMDIEKQTLAEANITPVICSCVTEDDVIAACHDADAIMDGTAPITRRVIESLTQCKLIIRCGTGYNSIDVQAATENHILVCYLPDYCMNEVADHAIALLMTMDRKIIYGNKLFNEYDWDLDHLSPIPSFENRVCGLIGFGRIGSLLAKRVAALDCQVLVYDPFVNPEVITAQGYLHTADIEELYRKSNFISLHLPLNDSTYHFIGKTELEKMKKNAILINVSRGPLIDEYALAEALKNGTIAAAGIDVFEHELPSSHMESFAAKLQEYACPLMELGPDKITLTPHTAWYSEKSYILLKQQPCEEVIRVLSGEAPRCPVNLHQLQR